MSKVILVGAGPGDPALLTVKAKEYIRQADCIVYDRLISDEILALAGPDCEKIYVGKENHHHVLPQEKIQQLLVQKAGEHTLVVRLKGGDPYVFGRGGEEGLYLCEHGIQTEVVPGISSSIAALAYAGIPITHRGIATSFQVITAHTKKDEIADIRYELLTDEKQTLVFLMGLSHVGEIAQGLIKAGRNPDTKAAVISSATTNRQKTCVGTLETIASLVKKEGLISPAIIVVGEVVGLSEQLDFFEKRPLFGRTYVVPFLISGHFSFERGWENQAENALITKLKALGAQVLAYPVGCIRPIRCELPGEAFTGEDVLVFTSQNAVAAALWNVWENHRDLRIFGQARIAAVGKKTAQALKHYGIQPDIVAKKQTGAGLGEELCESLQTKNRIVFFCAETTSGGLEQTLGERFALTRLVCYENIAQQPVLTKEDQAAIKAADGIFFTSASAGSRMLPLLEDGLPKQVYSIGSTCSQTLRDLGVTQLTQALEPSYEGLLGLCD